MSQLILGIVLGIVGAVVITGLIYTVLVIFKMKAKVKIIEETLVSIINKQESQFNETHNRIDEVIDTDLQGNSEIYDRIDKMCDESFAYTDKRIDQTVSKFSQSESNTNSKCKKCKCN